MSVHNQGLPFRTVEAYDGTPAPRLARKPLPPDPFVKLYRDEKARRGLKVELTPELKAEPIEKPKYALVLRGNAIKKSHCKRGHPLTTGNLYEYRNGNTTKRECRKCASMRAMEKRAGRKLA